MYQVKYQMIDYYVIVVGFHSSYGYASALPLSPGGKQAA